MKKASSKDPDEMRVSYKRSDFAWLERGRYAKQMAKSSNIVIIDDDLREAFPNTRAVNKGLRKLLKLTNAELKR
jgi:hypothetical protein